MMETEIGYRGSKSVTDLNRLVWVRKRPTYKPKRKICCCKRATSRR